MNRRSGFTLVEIIVIVAIAAALSSMSVISLLNYKGHRSMELEKNKIVGFLETARERAMAQEGGAKWGIRFDNIDNTRSFLAVFSGDIYSDINKKEVYYLFHGVRFVEPSSGQTLDVVFDKRTGNIPVSKIIVIENAAFRGKFGEIIIGSNGLISSRIY